MRRRVVPAAGLPCADQGLLRGSIVPVLFAVAMAVDGASGLLVGRVYDRRGPLVLLAVPVAASAAAIAFGHTEGLVWAGVAIWGVVNGVLDSTVKAVVTEIVPKESRASAFGWLALVRDPGLLVAGGALGLAYDRSPQTAMVVIVIANGLALAGLVHTLRNIERAKAALPSGTGRS